MDSAADSTSPATAPYSGDILLIDDTPGNLDLLTGILERAGYAVRPTTSARFGLQAALLTPPELVLLDIRMPEMDGFEVCRQLKASPVTSEIPVIFISALDEAGDKLRAFEAGGVDYITKPFENAEVLARVRTHLALARMQRGLENLVALRTAALEEKARDLREAEARYRTVADFTYDWEYWQGPDGSFLYVSPSCERISGHAARAFLEDPGLLRRIILPEDLSGWDKHRQEAEAGFQLRELEFRLLRPDGSVRWVEHACRRIYDGTGTFLGLRASNRDITGRKELERELRQAQKLEAIGTLAGGIAHDFNNILAAIFGYAEMTLADGDLSPMHKDNLANVLKAAKRAKDLVRQILTFCRKTEQALQPLQISLIVKEALKLLRSSLPTTIEIHLEALADEYVLADPTQIHQVVMNLCTNAYHAMRDTGGTLSVSLRKISLSREELPPGEDIMPGEFLQLAVRDTGHGMEKAVLDKIFEPYFTTKGEGEGTGLGLAVVHGIIKGHSGFVRVWSESGRGSVFFVHLPLYKAVDGGATAASEGSEANLPGGTERILVVDDEIPLLDMYRHFLAPFGYTVFALGDSGQALEVFRQAPERFDLVITDMAMPGMCGLELAQRMLAIRPGCPIILSTGYSDRIDRKKALAAGFAEFLQKPALKRDLLNTVRVVLDKNGSHPP